MIFIHSATSWIAVGGFSSLIPFHLVETADVHKKKFALDAAQLIYWEARCIGEYLHGCALSWLVLCQPLLSLFQNHQSSLFQNCLSSWTIQEDLFDIISSHLRRMQLSSRIALSSNWKGKYMYMFHHIHINCQQHQRSKKKANGKLFSAENMKAISQGALLMFFR